MNLVQNQKHVMNCSKDEWGKWQFKKTKAIKQLI